MKRGSDKERYKKVLNRRRDAKRNNDTVPVHIITSYYFIDISILVPTEMRLAVLALFIALPGTAYGAACPQQSSLELKVECAQMGLPCVGRVCCGSMQCFYIPYLGTVCPMVPFALIYVRLLTTELLCRDAYLRNHQNSI
jgi:hypothetical protein